MRSGGGSFGVGGLYGNGYYYPGVYYHSFVVQTFVAEESGVLRSISLVVQNHLSSQVGDPLVVSLVSILGDAVTPSQSIGNVLATAPIPAMDIELSREVESPYLNDYNATVAYNTGFELISGETYGIRIGTPYEMGSHLRIWLTDGNTFTGGRLFKNEILGLEERLRGDLFFKVMVTPVPEPTLLILATAGLFPLLLVRRRI